MKLPFDWSRKRGRQSVLQGMAGNIIHAIATTNAIIAGLITVVAIQILAGCLDLCKVRPWRLVTALSAFLLAALTSRVLRLIQATVYTTMCGGAWCGR